MLAHFSSKSCSLWSGLIQSLVKVQIKVDQVTSTTYFLNELYNPKRMGKVQPSLGYVSRIQKQRMAWLFEGGLILNQRKNDEKDNLCYVKISKYQKTQNFT